VQAKALPKADFTHSALRSLPNVLATGARRFHARSMTSASQKGECSLCSSGPKTIDGHEGLFTQAFSNSRVLFKCAKCGTVWSRSYEGSGAFEWLRVHMPGTLHGRGGVDMPPRGRGP
jgi:hypothetical protein